MYEEAIEEIYKNYLTETLYNQKLDKNKNEFKELIVNPVSYFQSEVIGAEKNIEVFVDFQEIHSHSTELKIHALQRKYLNHISKIEDMRDRKLDRLFHENSLSETNSYLDAYIINDLLNFMCDEIEPKLLKSLQNNLHEFISQDIGVNIDYYSLLNYLYILPSLKIQRSDIAIDHESGKIVIIYNANKTEFSSKKISIVANAKDFTVSVISRKSGLAKFSGVYASKFPEAYYKIESLMETLF